MEGRREDVETVRHLPLLSPLPFLCLVKSRFSVSVSSYKFPGIDVNLAFLHVMFSSVFESVSLATMCSHTMC